MKTKLTLRMEQSVIERAKTYAAQRGASVSELVENYFRLIAADTAESGDGAPSDWRSALDPQTRALLDRPKPKVEVDDSAPSDWRDALPPITRSLVGIAKGADVDEEEYRRYLEKKYG